MNRREYTVGDCFYQIRNGANIKQGDAAGGYPITRIETTANDTFNRDRMGYAGITDLSKYEGYVLEDGDLLMSHINSVQYLGRTVLYRKQGNETIIHGMNLLSLKANREIILPEFARYSFRSDPFKKQLSKITKKSVNQASFTVADLKKIPLAVPTLNEQRGIVQTLDKCLLVEAKRQQQLSALDDLIKARFVEMFGDETYIRMPLDSLSQGKGEYGAQSASEAYDPNRPRYVRITDINDDGTLNNDFVSSSNHEDDKQYKLYYGDFLFARMGATVGKTYAYKNGNQIYAGYLIRYKLNLEKILPEYLFAYTKTDEYVNWVHLNQSGAAQPGINAKKYGSLEIPVAPIDEQKAFVRFVTQVGKSKTAIQKSLDEAQLLFDSLMQEYFG